MPSHYGTVGTPRLSKGRKLGELPDLTRVRGEGPLAQSTKLGREHARVMAKVPAGAGGRFKSLKEKLAKKPGIKTPGALAAAIGRKKFGKKRFQAMAVAGKK